MKLFLASSLDKTLPLLRQFFPDEPDKTHVIFIANAADPYKEKWWVDLDRNKFKELGYLLKEVDIRNISPDAFSDILKDAAILHICGGSVYYLMHLLQEKNLVKGIVDAVTTGNIFYTGTSAGSIIASRSIAAFSYDEEEQEHIEKIPDKLGLGFINFGIVPHCNTVDFIGEHKKIVEHMVENTDPLIFLQDNQAVFIEDGRYEIVAI